MCGLYTLEWMMTMKKNGYFQLIHKDDGMYLKSFPAVEGGEPITVEDIFHYLDCKKIDWNDVAAVKKFVAASAGDSPQEIKISDSDMLPENEYLSLEIDPAGMFVKGRFYPPSSKGQNLTGKDVVSLLAQAGVKYGVLVKNIDIHCKAHFYCTDIVLAKAKKAVNGQDAKITYHFDVTKTRKPRLNDDGTVDFHDLDAIPKVDAGAVLATLAPAIPGEEGRDVFGKPILPKKIKNLKLKHGLNIHLSEDGLTMYADVSGHASLAKDQVFVSDTYEVPADVSASTGDIDYNGNVEVKGNVVSGYRVKATGDIIVHGVVEGASLEAGGQIIIKRGVQGMGKGSLKAAGDIVSKFLENCEVRSEASITTDAIMHSKVQAGEKIIVSGKRGLINGGEVRAGKTIEAKNAGSPMGTSTVLEVGVDPLKLERYREIEKEISKNEENLKKMDQVITLLEGKIKQGVELPEDKLKLLESARTNSEATTKYQEKIMDEYEEIMESIDAQKRGNIIVQDTAYPGVKLTVCSAVMFVRNNIMHSAFVREGADVRIRGI